MKKTFLEKSTMKGIFAGFMVCCLFGVVTFGADYWSTIKFFDSWNSAKMSNKLSAESWDEVLNRLDTMENSMKNALTDPSIVMPKGMVAAFNLSSCPDGWKSYDDAKGRFVIGVGSNGTATYSLGAKGGNSNSTLNVSNLPPHNHNIFIEYRGDDSDHDPGDVVGIGHHKADGYSTSLTAYGYTEDTGNGSNGNMKGTSFSVLNPYVALLYCEKL